MIKLANGKEVTTDEFYGWSIAKQNRMLISPENEAKRLAGLHNRFATTKQAKRGPLSEEHKASVGAAMAESIARRMAEGTWRPSNGRKGKKAKAPMSQEDRERRSATMKATIARKKADGTYKPSRGPNSKASNSE